MIPETIHSSGAGAPQMVRCLGCPMGEAGPSACHFESITIEARQEIPERYDAHLGFALVRRGLLIRQRRDAGDRTVAVDIVGPGQGYRTGQGTGYAVERTLLCVRSAPGFDVGQVMPGIGEMLLQCADRKERLMVARARATAEARVAALLTTLQDVLHTHPADGIPAELLQQDMAALLSMRHESVCRALRTLRERGSIRRDADGIQIVDRAALEAV